MVFTALAAAGLSASACSSDEADPTCGGVTTQSGECQKKCDETACAAQGQMKCVGNACAQTCANPVLDCPAGKYCYAVNADDGTPGQYCVWAPFTGGGKVLGQYDTTCTVDTECDELRGYKCLSGTCKLTGCKLNADCAAVPGVCMKDPGGDPTKSFCEKGVSPLELGAACTKSSECDGDQNLGCVSGACSYVGCQKHSDCAAVGECKPAKNAEGQDVLACVKGTTYPAGQFGSKCPGGTAKECDEANKFSCIAAAAGDVDSYCTKTDCLSDNDCALGYHCATVRTSKKPCADTCGVTGSSAAGCVPVADIGAGKAYSCGKISLLRNLCLKRDFCDECQSDDDCRAKPNQLCASDGKGHKYCTELCDPLQSNACSWGSAADCAVHDTALGKPTCAHKFGACNGTGLSCEPCRDDADCPNGLCTSSDYSGESFCVDLGPSCDCTGLPTSQSTVCYGGGCPKTPGGAVMACYGGSNVPATSPFNKKCLGGDSLNGAKYPYTRSGCWPL
jgi:hypothetical protein